MARPRKSQSKHNQAVKESALKLESQGFNVEADVPGFTQPKTIGGYRPDVVAKKGVKRVIVEVETEDSVDSTRDQKQQQVFKQAAKRSKNTKFKRTVV